MIHEARVERIVGSVVAVVAGLVVFVPFLWMFFTAFKPISETFAWPPTIIPGRWLFSNLVTTWVKGRVPTAFCNSLIYSVGVTSLYILITVPAGYAFAKYRFPGSSVLFWAVLATMVVPVEVIIVSLFMMLRGLGWLNTYHGLIIPRIAHGFGIFLLRQHMQTIPDELLDAARIDGSSELGIVTRIVVPLSKAPIGVAALFMFMWKWNELLWPLVVTSELRMRNMQVATAFFIQESYVEWNYLMMMSTISILPLVVFYIFLQRYFVRGVVLSGLKG